MILVTKPKLGSFISYGKFSDDRFCHLKRRLMTNFSSQELTCQENPTFVTKISVTKITASLKVLLLGQIDLIELSELHLLL
jgi:hypothetical protein